MRQKKWAAFEEFVRAHGDSLVRLSYVLCGDRGKAEDATQEALTRLHLRWGRIDEPLPYARRSVINATNDQWRRSGRRENRERHAAELPPEMPALLDDLIVDRDRLVQALRRVPDGQRAAAASTGAPPPRSGPGSASSPSRSGSMARLSSRCVRSRASAAG